MKPRNPIRWLAVVALVIVCLIAYLRFNPVSSKSPHVALPSTNETPAAPQAPTPLPGPSTAGGLATGTDTNKVYRIRADKVLATVNGVQIKLGDLVPLVNTNADAVMPLDAVSYNYFLDRAINRELIMQLAKAQGVGLTEAQQQRLYNLQAQREQPEPGLVAKLNYSSADLELQLRDTEAFMLQTAMMAQRGLSPNVTPAQVEKYYQDHATQFGEEPSDPQARKQWWLNVDIAIRELMQKQVRDDYNSAVNTVMDAARTRAQVDTANLE